MQDKPLKPYVLVDLAKNRIRIYQVTLHALQDPGYILIIVNPVGKTLGIMRGDRDDSGAHKVKRAGRASYELYSRSLTQKFREICSDWVDAGRYRMRGAVMPDKTVVQFDMDEAEFMGIGAVS